MTISYSKLSAIITASLLVAACGSGGGGSSGGTGGGGSGSGAAVVTPPPVISNGAASQTLNRSVGANIPAGSYARGIGGNVDITIGPNRDSAGNIVISNATLPNDFSSRDVTITNTSNGNTLSVTVAGLSNTLLANLPNTAANSQKQSSYSRTGSGTSGTVYLSNTLGSTSLSNSFYGSTENYTTYTINTATSTARIAGSQGYFFGGVPATNLPTSGTATYAGGFEGVSFVNNEAVNSLAGTANMNVNFAAYTVNGTITNINKRAGGTGASTATGYTINYNGSIGGTQFAGNSTLSGTNGSTGSGRVQGGFFGAGGIESVGVIGMNVTTPSGSGVIMGSFGTRRQ
jgi:hypothetical protein